MDSHGLPSMGCESSTQRSEGGQLQPRRMLGVNELLNAASSSSLPTPWPRQNQHPSQIYNHNHNQNPNLPIPVVQMQRQPGRPFGNPLRPPYARYDYIPYQAERQGGERLPQLPFPVANRRYNIPRDRGNGPYENNHQVPFEHLYGDRRHFPLPPPSPPLQRESENWPTNKMTKKEREDPVTKKCTLCLDEFVGADTIAMNFPYKCDKCNSLNMFCLPCLKDWFLEACKNEYKMPPRCCTVIPLSSVAHSLTQEQIDLYKAKFEEWRTPDRFYCPIPTCSTFIPPRLLKEKEEYRSPIRPTSLGHLISDKKNENAIPYEKHPILPHSHLSPDTSMLDVEGKFTSFDSPNTPILRTVVCPTCAVTICTQCRQLVHPGVPCPKTDVDPLLAAQLEKWKIKRCPKCRTGVRKMFGCSHIACRCGAHFCFTCLEPIDECEGQCEDYDEDTFSATDTLDPEDLDGQIAVSGTDELNLGDEPYNPTSDDWGCNHDFTPLYGDQSPNEKSMPEFGVRHQRVGPLDCQICWKVLQPINRLDSNASTGLDTEMVGSSRGISTEPGWPTTINGEPAWMCMGRHINCDVCPKDPVHESKTYKYRCEHRHRKCLKCEAATKVEDRAAVEEELKLLGDRGYECNCGMVVCGACKEGIESDDY